jgi:hypothetical protein
MCYAPSLLLPESVPSPRGLAHRYLLPTAREVGGDFYDFLEWRLHSSTMHPTSEDSVKAKFAEFTFYDVG